ncbi:MAG: 3'(2'),5'-bisphosphate nucleotidase [gamma proteobacterium symbiont of Ctena orbiculata]|uniref:3'(2'),5'-bisphosphate nucleotidase CysQ n=1 Tax=Candidatus Thiodiazotropha taylori TaxID=2792791 RepID=A0A944QTI0_9GAMM|nr:3'(2'),5'-bisphosphate nucleotidase CysQ [Candidatus Thiodiazotropha taylori]PUB85954.1 MAG: 3'(2'),5'-bisphosphate nucleotidase [gamma proteobacterium symbiont of Ctena orbiculata]MBT2989102.1 3'(2'),5'-bisphosphate nucleotidase CysQ [Candidatus Thiodiazotropha taylori]MBT2995686.1 3'(2'),5'-bisphosphate nucleotidase CysQ [Candidatus Thiodiazotropha taylori]MBT2999359.1 3'(2'),5'-bisphosphate nucleotidase CysQ [Candidatus Thiodiazotropha taylori]
MSQPVHLDELLRLAQQAGNAILDIYNTEFEVETKEDKSPLTAADKAAHNIIVSTLEGLTPDIPVLSEESSAIPYETRRQWQRYWLIDPLDGTREFIKRNGEFTVNIALIEGGSPTLGVVHAPVLNTTYYGVSGSGAWKKEADQPAHSIHVTEQRSQPTRVAGSRSHAGDSLLRFLENLGDHELVSMGSSLKLCLVAEGRADIYPRLGPTSEWDTAAAQAVVEAAGGQVTTLDLQPLAYNAKDSLLNPHFLVFGDRATNWSEFL